MRPENYTVEFVVNLLSRAGLLTIAETSSAMRQEGAMRAQLGKERRGAGNRVTGKDISPACVVSAMEFEAPDGTSVDEDRIMREIAAHAGIHYHKIDPLKLDADLISEAMTRPFAERHVCLPLERKGLRLVVAVDNPFDIELVETLKDFTQDDIEIVVSSRSDILKAITETYGFKQAVLKADSELSQGTDLGNLEQFVSLTNVEDLDSDDRHVIKAVEYVLHYAFDQRASDIHIEPKRENSIIRMRIDGVLHDVYALPMPVHRAVSSRIKMLARMDISERRRPQDGRIKTDRAGREVELRVSSMPVAFGEKVVIRIFDPEVVLQELDGIGFFPEDLERWRSFISRRTGLILVTGPTGSGKTTTLYSTLRQLASPRVNITTIEDPIELIVEDFNQVHVQPKVGINFASALRTVLRQDPDVVMVGEIRDAETASMAVQASLTGHLVLSTLHTNDAPGTITRLKDFGIEPFKIASTLVGVMAQRLMRTICDHCRTETVLTGDQIELLDIEVPAGAAPRLPVQYGKGCVKCRGTGLFGRTGIFEVMEITSSLRRLIKEDATAEELYGAAKADGMRTLKESAIRKMASGVTSFDEVAHALGEVL